MDKCKKIYIIIKSILFHKIEYYSDIKSNEILLHATTCLVNWKFYASRKTASITLAYTFMILNIQNKHIHRVRKQISDCQGYRGDRIGTNC